MIIAHKTMGNRAENIMNESGLIIPKLWAIFNYGNWFIVGLFVYEAFCFNELIVYLLLYYIHTQNMTAAGK